MARLVGVRGTMSWAALIGVLSSGAATAQQAISAEFDVRYGPFTIGRGALDARINDASYAVSVNARVTGLARLFMGGEGQASARGSIYGARVLPERYQIDNTVGDGTNAIRLVMRAGAVANQSVEPPVIPLPDRIPVHDYHRRGVVDPLSAFVFPAEGARDLADPSNCNRSLRVYDGRARYDIVLRFARTETLPAGTGPQGSALVCKARYVPIAGHRRLPPGARDEIAETEAWLLPIAGTRVLLLYRMQFATPYGRVAVQATKVALAADAQRQAAIRLGD